MPSSYSETAPDTYLSHPATAGPWGPDSQHGGPPAALLTRAVETLPRGERVIGRFTMELLGPVPVAELRRHLRALPKGYEVVAYCRGPYCAYADDAVWELNRRGFRARRLIDGFPEWKRAGLPMAAGGEG